MEKEKKSNHIKYFSQYAIPNPRSPKNILGKLNIQSNNSNKNNNIIIYQNNKQNSLRKNNKEITEPNSKINLSKKNVDLFWNKKNKDNKILIENFSQEEKMMNNSVNINNINLINSMNNITFYESNINNKKNKNIKKGNKNITVNKKISLAKDKKINNNNKYITTNPFKEINYKNFGINFALKGLKENTIYNFINQSPKEKVINKNKSNIKNSKDNINMINVNKLSIRSTSLNNLKFPPNSTSNIFSLLQKQNINKNKNNLSTPRNITSKLNLSLNKPKSEEKNLKKSKKYNKKIKYNLQIPNPNTNSKEEMKINNFLTSGNKTTTNNNTSKLFFSRLKTENKLNKKNNTNIIFLSPNSTHNNNYNSIKLNQSTPKISELNNNIINSFEKIEVNKNTFMKNYYIKKEKEKEKNIINYSNINESRNDNLNSFFKRTHQNSWTNSKEKIISFSNLDNINNINYNKKENNTKIIYNKKQLSNHNKIKSFNDPNKILSPFYGYKQALFEQLNESNQTFNRNNLEELSNSKDNNLDFNNLNYLKKNPLNSIYKKPDLSFINNSYLLIGKDALIHKNKNFSKYKEENQKKRYNMKLNKFLQKYEKNKNKEKNEKNELSIILNSENNNNSKEITMDTNILLNDISTINKINNKISNNNNFIKKYYCYFIKLKNQEKNNPCFITKKRIDKNEKIKKVPNKSIYYITKIRKGLLCIMPKIDLCYFRKDTIIKINDSTYKNYEILTERITNKEKDNYNNSKIIHTTKKIVNIEKYDKNNLKKTEKGLKLLEKIADKRISLSSLLAKKTKKMFKNNNIISKNIKNDLIENLNKITIKNYEIILNKISFLILPNNNKINVSQIIKNQNEFIDIIINKAIKEKIYIKIYAKLCKDLYITLITMLDNKNDDIDLFDKLTKENSIKNILKEKIMKKIENMNSEIKDLFYFINELFENKIFSIKTGFAILDLLLKQYLSNLNDIYLEGIETIIIKMKKIIYEKNNLEHIQRYNKYIKNHLFNIFQQREKSKDLPKFLYYRLYNILQNKNNNIIKIINTEYYNNKFYYTMKSDLEAIINMKKNFDKNKFLLEINQKYEEELNIKKSIELWEIFYYYVELCIDLINSENKIKLANEYINNIINNFIASIQNEIWEILHYKLISLFLGINEICVDNIYMYQIMGYLLYVLINNKLFYIKDLNNFLEKENYNIINIAKVVKYTIIFSEKNAKKFHNDFKQTKLFFGNNNFYNLVTLPLKKQYYEI